MNKQLLSFFQALGDGFLLLQTIKHNLVQSTGFSPSNLFQQISLNQNGIIDLRDLHTFLLKNKIQTSEGQIYTIFKQLDVKKKGYISAADFSQYFSNSAQEYSKFGFGEINLVKKFFNQLIDNHRRLQTLRIKLSVVPAQELFKQISKTESTTLSQFKSILIKSDITLSTVENLLSYFKSRGESSIQFDYFSSLIQPYQQAPILKQIPLTTSSVNKSSLINKLYSSNPVQNLEDFLNSKLSQNKQRRQFIQSHEKSRKQLMENIMKRQNSHKLSYDLDQHQQFLNKSQSLPYTNLISPKTPVQLKHPEPISSKLSYINTSPSYNIRDDKKEAIRNMYNKLDKQLTENNIQQISYPNDKSSLNISNLSAMIHKQQQQLQYQRAKRIQLQNQMSQYKKNSFVASRNYLNSTQNIHRDVSYLNYAQKEAPIYRQYGRSLSQNRKIRNTGRMQSCGSLWPKQYIPKLHHRQNMQQQLRKSRLDRQFAKFKLHKQMTQSKYLWR